MNFRNPFKNAVNHGADTLMETYKAQKANRGEAGYVMSRTSLMKFAQCPHKWLIGAKDDSTDATQWGSLVDCLLMSPSQFDLMFAVKPDTYEDEKGNVKPWSGNSNTCKEWLRNHRHLTAISSSDVLDAKVAASRVRADKRAGSLLNVSQCQVMITADYRDHDAGITVPCKILIDLVPDSRSDFGNCLADFKTGSDATAQKWGRHVRNFDYDAQAAMYLDVFNAETGQQRDEFRHIIQESEPPYEIGRRSLSHEFLEIGRNYYLSALRLYAWCLSRNEWPGYDDTTNEFENGWRVTHPEPWMIKECPFVIPQRENQLTTIDDSDPLRAA